MRKINVGCSMGLQGCKIEDVIEVEDTATEEDVEEEVREWALGNFEWWHKEKVPEPSEDELDKAERELFERKVVPGLVLHMSNRTRKELERAYCRRELSVQNKTLQPPI